MLSTEYIAYQNCPDCATVLVILHNSICGWAHPLHLPCPVTGNWFWKES